MSYDIVDLPSTGICQNCKLEWSSHLMNCGLQDCKIIGLHCHMYPLLDEFGFTHFVSGLVQKRFVRA